MGSRDEHSPVSPTVNGLGLGAFNRAFAHVIEQSIDAITVCDRDGVISAWNHAAAALFGYSAQEAVGRSPNFLVPKARGPESDELTASARAGQPAQELQTVRQRKDGRQIHVSITISELLSDQGQVLGTVAISRDISAMIRVQTQLREAERRLNEAQALAHVGSWEWDVGLEFPGWSAELCRIYGYDDDHVPGAADLFSRVHSEDRALLERSIEAARAGISSELRYRIVRPDGSLCHVHARHHAERDGTGHVVEVRGVVQDVTDRNRYEVELERLATHDSLTGLPNRRTFDDRFELELSRSVRDGLPLCLAVMDIDRFKRINDTFGHPAGDQVLRLIGAVLTAAAREDELIARVGGEEFAWILHGTEIEGACAAVERARINVGAADFGELGPVTISAGICARRDGINCADLYRYADLALLDAKRSGRDRVVVAPADG